MMGFMNVHLCSSDTFGSVTALMDETELSAGFGAVMLSCVRMEACT